MKLWIFLALLALACLAGAIFGALHDQVSYTVGPEYFTILKFEQFQIDPALPTRVGVALVGVLASWWMGLVIGVPVFGLGLLIPDNGTYWRVGLACIAVAMVVTVLAAAAGLVLALVNLTPADTAIWAEIFPLTDPLNFGRVAWMHNASYLGGGLGLVLALVLMAVTVRRTRRQKWGATHE